MKKIAFNVLSIWISLIFLTWSTPTHGANLEACGAHDLNLVMEQVPSDWSPWWDKNNDHMWLWNQYMDIYRYVADDGSWGSNGDNEFGGWPSDADLYDQWGFHWGSGLAMTCFSWWCECCEILESDIVFNPAFAWTGDRDYAEDYPASVLYYDSILLHEMGHSWGMQTRNEDYSYWEPTVMHSYNRYSIQDSMQIHVPEAWLIRRQYDDQKSIPSLTNMEVISKYADGTHLNWTNSTTDKTSYKAGENITVNNLTVENTGTVALSNVHLRLYLSTNRIISTGDTQIGDWSWGSYCSECYGIYDLTTTIPSGLPNGTYYVGAIITYNGYTEDSFWQDNTTRLWSTITLNSPDLIVQSMTTDPVTPFPGENVTVTLTIKNQGTVAAGSAYFDIYKNRATAPTVGEVGDSWCIAALAAGQTYTCPGRTVSYSTAGIYKMWAQADSDGVVAESNESNNVLGPQTLTVVNPPDLIVQGIATNPAGPIAGESVSVTVTVKNQGSGAAGGFYVEFYKNRTSAPAPYQGGDFYCWKSSLAAGATTTCTGTVSYASNGTYQMWSQVDSWLNVRESNENNNVFGPKSIVVAGINVTSPNGGEIWPLGSSQTIHWTSSGVSGNVKIDISRNGGTTWATLVGSTPNDGTHPWKVTAPLTTQARIRVSSVSNPATSDTSNANFRIGGGIINVTSPNGGEMWPIGTTQTINWSTGWTGGNVKIEVSRNGGSTWYPIISSTPNDGSYSWKVVKPASLTARIRVSNVGDASTYDISNANFRIGGGSVTVSAPNGGEVWPIGSTQKILWSTTGFIGNVKIDVSRNGGSTWTTLISSTTNDGSYDWKVVTPLSTTARIRVSSYDDPSVLDISNADFRIGGGSVTVIAPNGGETWTIGTSNAILWTTSWTGGNVKIEVSRSGGTSWAAIVSSTPNDGVYNWTVTYPATGTARIRVSNVGDPAVADMSNANFTIQ
jgi:hypothetical protein